MPDAATDHRDLTHTATFCRSGPACIDVALLANVLGAKIEKAPMSPNRSDRTEILRRQAIVAASLPRKTLAH
jgi:hypothetical protein